MKDKSKELLEKIAASKQGGGEKNELKHNIKKVNLLQERIDVLLDEGSFEEIGGLVTHRSIKFWSGQNQIFWRRGNYWVWDYK